MDRAVLLVPRKYSIQAQVSSRYAMGIILLAFEPGELRGTAIERAPALFFAFQEKPDGIIIGMQFLPGFDPVQVGFCIAGDLDGG